MAGNAESEDRVLVEALRGGDERAFARLIDRHHQALVHLAQLYVRDRSVAEDVAQETWLAVLEGIGRFEGRSSLKTWIYRILVNRARSRSERERRQQPFSTLTDDDVPEVDPERFLPTSDPRFPLLWAAPPRTWPHEQVLAREAVRQLRSAVQQLPPAQRVIIGLRDVDGWSAEEVCAALEITPGNQRVLLHRARSRIRQALEDYFDSR